MNEGKKGWNNARQEVVLWWHVIDRNAELRATQSHADAWIHPLIVTPISSVQLGRHNGLKARTGSRRSLAAPPRGKQRWCPLEGSPSSPEDSLQGEEGVLRPFGLLGGTGGGPGRVRWVRSRGRRDGVGDLCPFLKELIELCQVHTLVIKCQMEGTYRIEAWEETRSVSWLVGPYLHLSHLPLSRLLSG